MPENIRVKSVFELEVYKRAYRIALKLNQDLNQNHIPKYEQFGGLCDQMRRASRSICANLAEGWGKFSTIKERHQFTRIASGSANEMIVWLNFAKDLEYIPNSQCLLYLNEYQEISAMLRAMLPRT
jgi:four helix bundle protein